MPLAAPPPNFRYVGLSPAPPAAQVVALAGAAGLGSFALGLTLGGGADVSTLAAAGAVGTITALLVARGRGPRLAALSTQCPMAIVPWGVVLHSDTGARVLHWAGIKELSVRHLHAMDSATPYTSWSVVSVRTEHDLFSGRAAGGVSLELLEAHLQSYALESARAVAIDLDGREPLDDFFESTFHALLAEARRLLQSGELYERLSLSPNSYRQQGGRVISEESTEALREALLSGLETPADPRPLAVILAAELGAAELSDEIMHLTMSPHPLLAAAARAALLKLGGDVKRSGSLEELAEFITAPELEELAAWAK